MALFAYFIIRTFQLVFSAETVFFSHNNSVGTVFSVNSAKFQQAERGHLLSIILVTFAFDYLRLLSCIWRSKGWGQCFLAK